MSDTQRPTANSGAPDAVQARFVALGIEADSYDFRAHDMMRKVIAARMTASFQDVPHYALEMRVDVGALLAHRAELNDGADVRVSVNDLIIRAVALALVESPGVNISYAAEGMLCHRHADVAFAVTIEGGLITPIVRAAEKLDVAAIAQETKRLAERARARRLLPHEYNGGTFTVSNLGMYGISRFTSIINQPQAAILSVGAVEPMLVPNGDANPIMRQTLGLTLNCDHRAVDGATGAHWLACLKELLENPQRLSAVPCEGDRGDY